MNSSRHQENYAYVVEPEKKRHYYQCDEGRNEIPEQIVQGKEEDHMWQQPLTLWVQPTRMSRETYHFLF